MISTLAIDVRARPELVFELARRVDRWSSLLPHYLQSRILEHHADGAATARFVARREVVPWLGLGIPVAWRARTWDEPGQLRLHFRHLGGPTGGMDVTWRIEPTESGCRVSIEHDFRPSIAPWAIVVDRLVVRNVAGQTLRSFRAMAEALEPVTRPPDARPPEARA